MDEKSEFSKSAPVYVWECSCALRSPFLRCLPCADYHHRCCEWTHFTDITYSSLFSRSVCTSSCPSRCRLTQISSRPLGMACFLRRIGFRHQFLTAYTFPSSLVFFIFMHHLSLAHLFHRSLTLISRIALSSISLSLSVSLCLSLSLSHLSPFSLSHLISLL